ncbi:YadA-like family protein [Acinetobacter towneri]|nr:ESPR-type extended signal peptide-containing protein [Acinetobacter towneri]UIP25047.1 YadA-like family protein [Acinetobacter towneri]
MNKVYKVVWNASLGIWVAVSELAKGKTKTAQVKLVNSGKLEIITNDVSQEYFFTKFTRLVGALVISGIISSQTYAVTGIYVNDGVDPGCSHFADPYSTSIGIGSVSNPAECQDPVINRHTVTNKAMFFGADGVDGSDSLILSGQAYVNSGSLGLGGGQTGANDTNNATGSVRIGGGRAAVSGLPVTTNGTGTLGARSGQYAIAIGGGATIADATVASGEKSIAVGFKAKTNASDAVALGNDATANTTNSVALGASSITTAQSGNSFLTDVAASTVNGVVSVGTASATRRIQNVADGAADQDAVTVAQLKDVNNRAVGNTTALGGGAAYDPTTNTYTAPTFTTTKTDGTTVNATTVAGALTNLNNEVIKPITFNANTGSSTNKLGSTLNITGGLAGTGSNANVKTVITGNTVDIQIANAPTFSGTVIAGNLATGGTLSVTGVSNLNGGANLNNQKITNLRDGSVASGSKDAVNGGQLFTTNNNVTTAQNTANTALTEAQKGLNFRANAGASDKVGLGETVTLADGTNTTVTYDAATNTYKYSVVNAPTFTGTVTAGNLATGGTLSVTGVSNLNGGANLNNQKITSVAAGTASGDAVNFGQLTTTNNNVTTAQNAANAAQTSANAAQTTANSALTEAQKGLNFRANAGATDKVSLGETITLADGTNTTVTYNAATNTYKYNVVDAPTFSGTVTAGNLATGGTLTVTGVSNLNGGANLNNQKITNLGDGSVASGSKDAVNGGQLFTTNNNVTTAQNTANSALTNANNAQTSANTAQSTANTALTEAQKGLNFRANAGASDKVGLGETVTLADGTNTTVTYDAATNTYKYSVVNAPTFTGTVTAGNLATGGTLSVTGVSNLNGGANLNNQKITSVAAGTASGDAVNFGQLTTTNNNVTTAQNAANAAQTSANAAQTTANSALTEAQKGLNFRANAGATDKVSLGETITLADGTNTTVTYNAATNTYKYNVVDAPTFAGTVTAGNLATGGTLSVTGVSNLNGGANLNNQKITNLRDGSVASGSKDAVNGGQLFTTNNNVTTAQNTANTALTEAQKGLNFRANAGASDKVGLGETVTLADGTNTTVTYDAATNTYKYSVVNAPTFTGTVTAGNLATGGTLSVTGVSNLNGGANLNNQKITSVAAGTASGDAVNFGQLTTTNNNVTTAQNAANAAQTSANAAQTTANSALTEAQKGLNFRANAGATDKVSLGETITLADGTNTTVTYNAATNTYKYNVVDAPTFAGTVTAGNLATGGTLSVTGVSNLNGGANLNNQKITNLGDGSVASGSKDAVNGSQLFTTNQKVDQNTTNIAKNTGDIATNTSDITTLKGGFNLQTNGTNVGAIKAGDTVDIGVVDPLDTNLTATKTNNNVAFALSKNLNLTSVTTGNTVINNAGVTADKVTVGNVVIDKSTNKISGVEAGTNTKDAVNKGQLDALAAQQAASDNAAVKYDDAAVKDKVTLAGASGTTLTNVKAGDVSATSTDAVNGSQLFTTNQKVDQNTTNIAKNTGDIATNTANIATNTSDITTLKGGFNLQTNGTNVGAIKAGDTVDIGVVDPLDTNLTATKTNNNVAFALSKNLNLTSVTTGNTVINNAGVTADKVTVGNVVIDKSTNKISGVEAGTNTKDAVNKGQLDALAAQQAASDNAAVKYDDAAVKDKVTLAGASGTTLTNVKAGDVSATSTDAVNGSQLFTTNQKVDQNTTNIAKNTGDIATNTANIATNTSDITTLKGGFNLQTNGANSSAIKAGDTVDIGVVDPLDTNLTATKTNNNVAFALSKNLNLTSVTTGNTVINNAGVTADKVTVGNVVIDKSTNKISGVEAGTNTKDAVNKGQLDALAAQQAASDNAAVKYDDAAVKDKVTLAGASGTTLTNVKAGDVSATSTDAVNGSQLFTTNQKVDQNTTNIAKNTGDIATNTSDITTLKGGFNLQTNGTNVGAIKAGDTVDIGVVDPLDTNLTATKTNNNVAFALSKNLNLTSVTTGNTVINNAGVTADKVTVGNVVIDKTTNQISGVEAGTNTKDAVNKGQLDALAAQQAASDNAAVKYDDAAVKDKVTLAGASGTTLTNVKAGDVSATSTDAVNGSQLFTTNQKVDQNTTNIAKNTGDIATNTSDITTLKGGFNLQTNGTNVGAIKAGDTVDIGVVDPLDTNLTATKTNNNVAFALSKNLNLTSVTTGNTVINNAGVTADKVTVGNVVIDKSTNKISGVEAGTNTKDAVNKGQLDALAAQQAASDNAAVKYDDAAVKDKVTLAGASGTTLTNVKAGDVSATSTDAVNGSQLFTTNQKVDQNTTNIAKNTGDIATNTANIATNTSDITTLKGGFNLQTNGTNVGAIKAGDTVDIGVVDPLDTNLTATKTNNNVAFALSKNLNLTSVTTGNTVINNAGVTADKVTVGNVVIDKSTNKISGVEAGTNTKDAVNKGQLDALAAQQAASDNAAVKYDDAAVKDKVTLAGASGTTLTNVKAGDVSATSTDAVNGSQLFTTNQKVDQNTTNIAKNTGDIATNTSDITTLKGGFNLQTNGTNVGAIKAGDTVDIGVVDPLDTNLTATKTNNNVAFALSKNLNLTSVTTGNTVINNAGVTADKVTVGNVVIDKSTNKISGVEAGTNTKDAVNKGQLDALAAQQAASDNAAVKYDDAAVKDKVTLAGASGTTLTNVKAGDVSATSTDAVNGSQLFTTNQKVDQNTTNIAKNTGDIATNTANIATNTSDITTLKGGFNLQTNGTNVGAIKAGDTVDIGVVDPLDTNLTATKTNNNVAFALSKNLNLTSVTTGNTVINNAGVTADKVTVGNVVIDKSTNKISGVEAGTNTKDAVNKGQLDALAAQQAASDNAAVKYDDAAVKDKVTLAGASGTTLTNVKAGDVSATSTDAVNGSQLFTTNQKVDQNTTNIAKNTGDIATNTSDITTLKGGFNLQTNGTNVGAIKAGDTVDIGVVDPLDTNLTATKTNNNVAFALSKNLNLTSVTTGNTVINNAGVTADKVTVGNVVIDKSTNKISGVEAGTNTKDAVNKGQLDALAAQQAASDNAAVKYDDAAVKDKVTLAGASGTTLTNVKAGDVSATSTDAVNGSQLFTTNQKVDQNTTNIAKNTGDIATNTANIATNTSDITTLKGGFNLQTNGANSSAIKAGDTVDIGVVDPLDTNLTATKTNNNVAFALSKNLNLTSVTTGNTVINNAGVTADKVTVGNVVIDKSTNKISGVEAGTNTKDAVNKGQLDALAAQQAASDNAAVKYDDAAVKDKITLGGANGTTISNVKDGTVAQGSKEAVNGGQLWNVQQQVNQNTSDIENIQTNINNINNGKSGLVQQQTPNGDITIGKDTGGTKVSVAGKDGDRVVTGVKDGVISATSKDAVNGSQLNVTNNKVVEFLGGGAGYDNITNSFTNPTYTVGGKEYNNVGGAVDALNKADQALDSKIDNVSNRLEQAFYSTNQRIDDVEKRANAGIAAAMALEAAPFVAGKYTYAAGASYHGGENAVGVTLRKTADNGRWSITGGVAAASQGDPSVRIGISGVID